MLCWRKITNKKKIKYFFLHHLFFNKKKKNIHVDHIISKKKKNLTKSWHKKDGSFNLNKKN